MEDNKNENNRNNLLEEEKIRECEKNWKGRKLGFY